MFGGFCSDGLMNWTWVVGLSAGSGGAVVESVTWLVVEAPKAG